MGTSETKRTAIMKVLWLFLVACSLLLSVSQAFQANHLSEKDFNWEELLFDAVTGQLKPTDIDQLSQLHQCTALYTLTNIEILLSAGVKIHRCGHVDVDAIQHYLQQQDNAQTVKDKFQLELIHCQRKQTARLTRNCYADLLMNLFDTTQPRARNYRQTKRCVTHELDRTFSKLRGAAESLEQCISVDASGPVAKTTLPWWDGFNTTQSPLLNETTQNPWSNLTTQAPQFNTTVGTWTPPCDTSPDTTPSPWLNETTQNPWSNLTTPEGQNTTWPWSNASTTPSPWLNETTQDPWSNLTTPEFQNTTLPWWNASTTPSPWLNETTQNPWSNTTWPWGNGNTTYNPWLNQTTQDPWSNLTTSAPLFNTTWSNWTTPAPQLNTTLPYWLNTTTPEASAPTTTESWLQKLLHML